jgi:hypothetical protein
MRLTASMSRILIEVERGAQLVTLECSRAANGRGEQTWLTPHNEKRTLADPRSVRVMVARGYLTVSGDVIRPAIACYHITPAGREVARNL